MSNSPKYYIVEASALPEVFLKVAETKRILSTGEATTVNEATKITGISRSAFYKYRDSVLPFQSLMTGRLITFQFRLLDEPGVLSSILTDFAKKNKNLTVKCGVCDGAYLDEAGVAALANTPSREVLIAKIMGSMMSSVSKFVYCVEALRKKQAGEE